MVSIWWLLVLFFAGSFIGMLITALMCMSASQSEQQARTPRQARVVLSDEY
jgi:formate-dependent nitrite reductase membrane component NrfD